MVPKNLWLWALPFVLLSFEARADRLTLLMVSVESQGGADKALAAVSQKISTSDQIELASGFPKKASAALLSQSEPVGAAILLGACHGDSHQDAAQVLESLLGPLLISWVHVTGLDGACPVAPKLKQARANLVGRYVVAHPDLCPLNTTEDVGPSKCFVEFTTRDANFEATIELPAHDEREWGKGQYSVDPEKGVLRWNLHGWRSWTPIKSDFELAEVYQKRFDVIPTDLALREFRKLIERPRHFIRDIEIPLNRIQFGTAPKGKPLQFWLKRSATSGR